MNLTYLNNKKHVYLGDHNVIINSQLKDAFLNTPHQTPIEVRKANIDKEIIKNRVRNVEQVIFQCTQDCNLRCKYCAYGGTYQYQRTTAPGKLDPTTARQAVDYIFSIVKDRLDKHITMSFYGGEPLLDSRIIGMIVQHAKQVFAGWELRFNMTTNLTLLTTSMIGFLIKNNFHLSVSLDGPRDNHNAKRVFANGRGSFDRLTQNLEKLKQTDRQYYDRNVGFEVTFSPDLSLKDVYRFFVHNPLVNKNRVQLAFVDKYDTSYFEKYPYDEERIKQEMKEIIGIIRDKQKNNRELFPFEECMRQGESLFKDFLKTRGYTTMAGTCFFDSRLFIDVNGSFHTCEKINDRFSFGDVWQGFDVERMEQLLLKFSQVIDSKCSACKFRHLCGRCFVPLAKDGTFKLDRNFCEDMQKTVKDTLEALIRSETTSFRQPGGSNRTVKKFHQFVVLEKGNVNTAVIDFMKGNIYQVENAYIDKFRQGKYSEIPEFMEFVDQEGLILEIEPGTWVPQTGVQYEEKDLVITLEIEEGADLTLIAESFRDFRIDNVVYYGKKIPAGLLPYNDIPSLSLKQKDLSKCEAFTTIDGDFPNTRDRIYRFNHKYNSCWGQKAAVTADNKVRPCIYSDIDAGDLKNGNIAEIMEELKTYWEITKDNVETCKECELRFACFDCREIARKKSGHLLAANPNCKYNPATGTWNG